MATTEALSREQIRLLAKIASGECAEIDAWGYLQELDAVAHPLGADLNHLWSKQFFVWDMSKVGMPPKLTHIGWAALKEHADAQGDL